LYPCLSVCIRGFQAVAVEGARAKDIDAKLHGEAVLVRQSGETADRETRMYEKGPYKIMKTKLDFELWIHRIPGHLAPPLPRHLRKTHEVWMRVVEAGVCWRVSRIDAWNHLWIDVRFKNDAGELEDHSLAIDEDCFEKIDSLEYEVETENFVDKDGSET
jgi:hypothetical protein